MFRNMTDCLLLVSSRPISGNPESSVPHLSATLSESSTIMAVSYRLHSDTDSVFNSKAVAKTHTISRLFGSRPAAHTLKV
jgi:hypothetical protein